MNDQMPDPKVQSFYCQDCRTTVSASQMLFLRHGMLVVFDCQCPRSNIVVVANDLKTLIPSPGGTLPKSLIVMLSSDTPKILVPNFRPPSDFDPHGN